MKTKRTILLILTACTLALLQPTKAQTVNRITGREILPGDANCDMQLDLLDVITIADFIMGQNPQPFCFENADVNNDGIINTIDAIGTVTLILTGGIFNCGTSIVYDIDGNFYNTVMIEERCWLAENLKTTHYRNGTPIEYPGNNNLAWQNNTSGAYAWYENDISWKHKYGALYNWFAVNNPNGLCPDGWQVADLEAWADLIAVTVQEGSTHAHMLKSCRQVDSPHGPECNTTEHPRWNSSLWDNGTDDFGFSALPGGLRFNTGNFSVVVGHSGQWWTGTAYSNEGAWRHFMINGSLHIYLSGSTKAMGCSVRCLKD